MDNDAHCSCLVFEKVSVADQYALCVNRNYIHLTQKIVNEFSKQLSFKNLINGRLSSDEQEFNISAEGLRTRKSQGRGGGMCVLVW